MKTSFYDIPLLTAPGQVFTPRASTERLVDEALQRIDGVPMRVADVGTGSGAVAIALALNRPNVEVWATDTSAAAVELARENAKLHGVEDRVHVVQGDLLEPIAEPVELVVANLPYLSERERRRPPAARCRSAGRAPGDGLDPYRRLLNACRDGKLETGGTLLIQFHRDALAANCWELEDLREQLEASA
jgi:release factor glutamine methyltransferase